MKRGKVAYATRHNSNSNESGKKAKDGFAVGHNSNSNTSGRNKMTTTTDNIKSSPSRTIRRRIKRTAANNDWMKQHPSYIARRRL
ncbi:MAG: hypothetical protein GXO64_01975 [Candidatus Micrarchaeota archaeon]|nr:hypothetical protein [Candidatus Micrarchaeota archaeon]